MADQQNMPVKVDIEPSKASDNKMGYSAKDDAAEIGACHMILYVLSLIIVVITFPFSMCVCLKIVTEYQRAVVFRLGRCEGAKGPGLFFILPCMDDIFIVDLRTVSFDIPPQEILTKDSVTCTVDAVVYYRIFNPVDSVANVANAAYATKLLASTTLRNQLGSVTLQELLSQKENLSNNMRQVLDEATDPWGIKVERVEVKDVRLPHTLQRSMAAEAEATREANAKIIAAKGEFDASMALRDAADMISQSPGALQLRYLQTLGSIAAEKNSTIVFPLPMEIMKGMAGSN